jgi:hypothetical protein
MGKNTSRNSRFVAGTTPQTVQEALSRRSPVPRSEYVTVAVLAKELKVPPARLRPIVEHGYLKVLELREYLDDCIVARPLPAGLAWLRQMLGPTYLQPMLSLEFAALALGCPVKRLRELCAAYNVPIHLDPALGPLLAPRGLHALLTAIYRSKGVNRFDRQALLAMTMRTKSLLGKKPQLLPYSVRLEQEIARIARLPEPQRTFKALALWDSYRDAKTVADCISRYRGEVMDKGDYEEKLKRLIAKVKGDESTNGESQPAACDDASSHA